MPQKISTKKWPKNDLKLPKIAQKLPKIAQIGPKMTQKLAPAEKNSTEVYLATKKLAQKQKWPKNYLQLPKIAQK